MLDRLATIGMELAELAAERVREDEAAKPGTPRPAGHNPRLHYAWLANDVRQSLAMYARIEAGIRPAAPRDRTESPRLLPLPRAPQTTPRETPRLPPAPPPPARVALAPLPPPPLPAAAPFADSRRPGIARYILQGLENTHGPTKAEALRPEIEARITAELAKDPQGEKPGTEIFTTICNDIGLPLYYAPIGPDLKIPPKNAALFGRRQSTGPPRFRAAAE